ncbi:hypothetical protein Cni_G27549 [Canna indica]|uniref:Uncharacterized protein n=1 Tax=Canna indica TaxID=4628 RepID=A0AAQ3L807_9LILI|nr:hypothetical protein Cni_G27549 [Canna indica]
MLIINLMPALTTFLIPSLILAFDLKLLHKFNLRRHLSAEVSIARIEGESTENGRLDPMHLPSHQEKEEDPHVLPLRVHRLFSVVSSPQHPQVPPPAAHQARS